MSRNRAIFNEPADKAIAGLVGVRLDEMAAACFRLQKGGDAKALHDMRVAMRRLRSLFRAYPDTLDVPRKQVKQLKKLARGTNAARDAEVRLAWLTDIEQQLPQNARDGLALMQQQARGEMAADYEQVNNKIVPKVPGWINRARKRLRKSNTGKDSRVFGELFGTRLQQALQELEAHLGKLDTDEGLHEAHAARIAGKRVRYLIEGVAEQVPGGKQLIRKLKALQDLLGDIHDAQVRLAWLQEQAVKQGGRVTRLRLDALIASEGRTMRTEQPDPVVSLMAVARLTLKQRRTLFREVLAQQRKRHYQSLLDELRGLAHRASSAV